MNNANSALNVLTGGSNAEEVDYKQLYEDSQKKLHTEQVEAGRLRKTQDELERLRKENEELRRTRETDDIISSVSSEEIENEGIPEGYIKASAKMAQRAADQARLSAEKEIATQKAMFEQEIERNRERYNNSFVESVDRNFPGFLKSIDVGGDKKQAWETYLRHNAESVNSAVERHDMDTLSYHIKTFYNSSLGIKVPSSEDTPPVSEPRTMGGGTTLAGDSKPGRTYTVEEFSNLFDLAEKYRDEGNFAKVKEISEEIKKAQLEGRIK